MKFLGAPYPIDKHPRGLLHTQNGINQVKSDLLVLLLTNPGERVMLPDFGTPLRKLIHEQNDSGTQQMAIQMISDSIRMWEPRIAVNQIDVVLDTDEVKKSLNENDNYEQIDHVLLIRISFFDFDNINEIQELRLEVPLGG